MRTGVLETLRPGSIPGMDAVGLGAYSNQHPVVSGALALSGLTAGKTAHALVVERDTRRNEMPVLRGAGSTPV